MKYIEITWHFYPFIFIYRIFEYSITFFSNIINIAYQRPFWKSIKLVSDVKKTDYSKLAQLIGPGIAKSLKEQVGEEVDPSKIKIAPRKRKGQKNLADW